MSLIVLEGIDRVGKTTLAKQIETFSGYGFKTLKEFPYYGDFDRKVMVEKMCTTLNIEQLFGSNIILDRFHISEFVYGFFDRSIPIDFQVFHNLEKRLKRCEALLVHVEPVDLERSNQEAGRDQSDMLLLFRKLFEMSELKKYSTNYDEILNGTACRKILEEMQK